MSVAIHPLAFAVMAKKGISNKEPTNVRIDGELLDRARDFIAKQPVRPTMTGVIEAALLEWLDRHHPNVSQSRPRHK